MSGREASPSPVGQFEHRKLNKIQALAAFSPDALASIGYADQEIHLDLLIAGSLGLAFPIAFAITGLLAILARSYYQIIQKYPWRFKALPNAIGALATGVTFVTVGSFKFFDGAWIAVLLIPLLVALFLQVNSRRKERQYDSLIPELFGAEI